MGGSLDPETTPGGGLTMVLRMPAADLSLPAPDDDSQAADPAALERIEHWRSHR
jgi:two-component system sensor histidine kinase KdpD